MSIGIMGRRGIIHHKSIEILVGNSKLSNLLEGQFLHVIFHTTKAKSGKTKT
jgi:hypothetical protein